MKDYYEILGVSRNATKEVIAAAYSALSKKLNPLTNSEVDQKPSFVDIAEAFCVLTASREAYDRELEKSVEQPTSDANPDSTSLKQDLDRRWSIAVQFDKTGRLREDHARLSSMNEELGVHFQEFVLQNKLVESPVEYVRNVIDQHYAKEFGQVSPWMEVFIERLYSGLRYKAIDDLKQTIRVVSGAVDDFEIIQLISKKFELENELAAAQEVRDSWRRKEEEERAAAADAIDREKRRRAAENERGQIEKSLQMQVARQRLETGKRQERVVLVVAALIFIVIGFVFIKPAQKKSQVTANVNVDCGTKNSPLTTKLLCEQYWEPGYNECREDARQRIVSRGIDPLACKPVAPSGIQVAPAIQAAEAARIQEPIKTDLEKRMDGIGTLRCTLKDFDINRVTEDISPIAITADISSKTMTLIVEGNELQSLLSRKALALTGSVSTSDGASIFQANYSGSRVSTDGAGDEFSFSMGDGTVIKIHSRDFNQNIAFTKYDRTGVLNLRGLCK